MALKTSPDRLLTPDEVRERLSCSKSKFYTELIGGLPHVKIGRLIRIPERAFEKWLDSKRVV